MNRQRLVIALLVAVLVVIASYLLGGVGEPPSPASPGAEAQG